jgi:hypothetical protein
MMVELQRQDSLDALGEKFRKDTELLLNSTRKLLLAIDDDDRSTSEQIEHLIVKNDEWRSSKQKYSTVDTQVTLFQLLKLLLLMLESSKSRELLDEMFTVIRALVSGSIKQQNFESELIRLIPLMVANGRIKAMMKQLSIVLENIHVLSQSNNHYIQLMNSTMGELISREVVADFSSQFWILVNNFKGNLDGVDQLVEIRKIVNQFLHHDQNTTADTVTLFAEAVSTLINNCSEETRLQMLHTMRLAHQVIKKLKEMDYQYVQLKFKSLMRILIAERYGRYDHIMKEDSVQKVKNLILPTLINQLSSIPLPSIGISDDSFEFSADNMHLSVADLFTDCFDIEVTNHLNNESLETKITFSVKDLRTTISDILFSYNLKNTICNVLEQGHANVHLGTQRESGGLSMKISWSAIHIPCEPLQVKLGKVRCSIDDIVIDISESKYPTVTHIATALFSGVIKNCICTEVEDQIREILEPLNGHLNEIFQASHNHQLPFAPFNELVADVPY